jgi:hypothetical protein
VEHASNDDDETAVHPEELTATGREPDVLRFELLYLDERVTVEISGDDLAKFNECGYLDLDVPKSGIIRVRGLKEAEAADVGEKLQLEAQLATEETFGWLDAIHAPRRKGALAPATGGIPLRSTRTRARPRNVRTSRAKARAPDDPPLPDHVTHVTRSPGGAR